MLTNDELDVLSLSPTNKDYYQIWSELLETASKISERWDPSSTNESDPGIVLLKVLTAIADKLNYNIDKSILEAFMPTAAQEESMHRLCTMLGYHVKYYRSATTNVTLRYTGNVTDTSPENTERLPDGTDGNGIGLYIPAFTPISTEDKSIYYLTTVPVTLTNENTIVSIPCIEGQHVVCETGNNSVVTLANLDKNNRYYLPESRIAENGIFISNILDGILTEAWTATDNLNIIPSQTKAFAFGYDSKENRPYVQFPSDIAALIEDGLQISYLRTNGAAGNIAARTLTVFSKPTTGSWANYSDSEKFTVTNPSAALNGKNPETIEQAYNGFKKTIGTFNTLVTCRDYINGIYNLLDEQDNPVVSNVIVADIRDDINRAFTLCSYSDYGILYRERALLDEHSEAQLDHFDLMLYPFKVYQNLNSRADYERSFNFDPENILTIESYLKDTKNIAHNFITPTNKDVVCIKNYLKLNARISTTQKVNTAEEKLILNNIKTAIFEKFNMRELDFGEEIPYDTILATIKRADPKIKECVLDEPVIYTRFVTGDNVEYDTASSLSNYGREIYNKLLLRNILAGRVELFKYDTAFKTELGESQYIPSQLDTPDPDTPASVPALFYPADVDAMITSVATEANIPLNAVDPLVQAAFDAAHPPVEEGEEDTHESLATPPTQASGGQYYASVRPNEVVKFRAPNLKTVTPFAAYINYHLILGNSSTGVSDSENPALAVSPVAARFMSLDNLWENTVKPEDSYVEKLTAVNLIALSAAAAFNRVSLFEYISRVEPRGYVELAAAGVVLDYAVDYRRFADTFYDFITTAPKEGEDCPLALYPTQLLSGSEGEDDSIWDEDNQCLHFSNSIPVLEGINPNALFKFLQKASKQYCLWYTDDVTKPWKRVVYSGIRTEFSGGYYRYIEIKNDTDVFGVIKDWAATFAPDAASNNSFGYTLCDRSNGKVTTELWRRIEPNDERNIGVCVDNSQYKYMPCTKVDSSITHAWTAYYWPAPQISNGTDQCYELSKTGWSSKSYSTKDSPSKGVDMVLRKIRALEEYELRDNDHLFINYTPSSSTSADSDASVEATPVNLHYGKGTIIRPNEGFTEGLMDSVTYFNSGYHSWVKTTGFDFSAVTPDITIDGMYSLEPNQQLDIREFIKVDLKEPSMYMYWILDTDRILEPNNRSFILGPGEYIFYTDKNKLDMVYYGNGTEISLSPQSTKTYTFKANISQASIEEIIDKGLSAIPWRAVNFNATDYLIVQEYQYVTLTEGCKFKGLVTQDNAEILANQWKSIDEGSCYYGFADAKTPDTPLPLFNLAPDADGNKIGWEARSYLELHITPDTPQILNPGNSITLTDDKNGTRPTVITATDDTMAVKANTTWQSAGDTVKLTKEGNKMLDFRLKVFKDDPVVAALMQKVAATGDTPASFTQVQGTNLVTNNFNSIWTSIDSGAFSTDNIPFGIDENAGYYNSVKVATIVPAEHYNLLMVYYIAPADTIAIENGMGFRFIPTDTSGLTEAQKTVKIFNHISDDFFKTYLDTPNRNLVNFTTYFENLSWWNNLEVSVNSESSSDDATTPAIGTKKVHSAFYDETTAKEYEDITIDNVYFLKPGLNLLVYMSSGNFEFLPDTLGKGTIFLSEVDSVRFKENEEHLLDLGLNLDVMDFKYYTKDSVVEQDLYSCKATAGSEQTYEDLILNKAALQLLRKIKAQDPAYEFYYNCPLQAATALDINTNLTNTTDEEKLSDFRFWYDTNNINNKFVISQIDAEYLDSGIMITKASKTR